jgi:hypothetical protein
VPVAFLAMLVLWLTVMFTTFGMLAPRSRTMVLVLFVCSLSVSGAIFLVLLGEATVATLLMLRWIWGGLRTIVGRLR